jgi:hypothetical protein
VLRPEATTDDLLALANAISLVCEGDPDTARQLLLDRELLEPGGQHRPGIGASSSPGLPRSRTLVVTPEMRYQ